MDSSHNIVCPNCKKSIPLTEALSHQINEEFDKKMEDERRRLNAAAKKWKEDQQKKLDEEQIKAQQQLQEQLKEQLKKQMELKMTDANNEREELKKQNEQLQKQFLDTNKLIRQLRTEKEQTKLELEKKLAEEQEKIRTEEKKRADEENRLKMLEYEKKLQDALRSNDDLKRKLEQGSQQLQGEVLELEIENILKHEFPYDEIKPVAKGVRGGDLIQIVRNQYGKVCGTILWEFKRTKSWGGDWISKLKEDQRSSKADMAVIVSQILPATIKRFGWQEDVCIGDYDCIMGIALALRRQLFEITRINSSLEGKQDKMEVLYSYLSGIEFKHRVEAIVEAFSTMQDDIEKEKRWFSSKWAKQEKNIRKVLDNTLGMHGDLQSIMGKELAEVDGLDMLPTESDKVLNGETKDTLF